MASVNNKRERDQIEIIIIIKKNFIGRMLLVCGRSIKQTMKTKVILRIPLTDNILESVNDASICCSSSNEGFP